MQLKTILNRVHKIKGFVYGSVKTSEWNGKEVLEVEVHPRKRSRPICSGCGKKRPGYDKRDERRFELIPLWGIEFFLLYTMRRVNCPTCGIKIEKVPWAKGKNELTLAYQWFLAGWAKRLSWAQVADAFHTSWYNVYHSVEMAVEWGRARINLEGITAIGIDEMQWGKGHNYVTVVYQINEGCKRLLWLGKERKAKTLLKFFRWFGEKRSTELKFVCSDMWAPYLKVVKKKASEAINILDRFHIVAHMNKAIDEVRAGEARELITKGLEPVLKGSRWWFLKRPWNLTPKQIPKLAEVLRYNLRTVRSYLLNTDFRMTLQKNQEQSNHREI